MTRLERIYWICYHREQEIFDRHYVSPKAMRRRQEILRFRIHIAMIIKELDCE